MNHVKVCKLHFPKYLPGLRRRVIVMRNDFQLFFTFIFSPPQKKNRRMKIFFFKQNGGNAFQKSWASKMLATTVTFSPKVSWAIKNVTRAAISGWVIEQSVNKKKHGRWRGGGGERCTENPTEIKNFIFKKGFSGKDFFFQIISALLESNPF